MLGIVIAACIVGCSHSGRPCATGPAHQPLPVRLAFSPPCPQSLKLLPRELDAQTLARFLRACPGLAKPAIGEILGERDTFYEDVRAAFMQTFDFTGGWCLAMVSVVRMRFWRGSQGGAGSLHADL